MPEHGGKYLAERLHHVFELIKMTPSYTQVREEIEIEDVLDLLRNAPNPPLMINDFIEAIKQDDDLRSLPLWEEWVNRKLMQLKDELEQK